MKKTLPLLLALTYVAAPDARAAESFDACTATITSLPTTITKPGRYCLAGDLATAIGSGAAIHVAANNATVDCNGFRIGNLAAGNGSLAYGVYATAQNTRVTGCHFRGFYMQVMGESAHGARVDDNQFEGGLVFGVRLHGDGVQVRDNRFVDVGGAANQATAVLVDGSGVVRDNQIDGVTSTGTVFGVMGSGDVVVADNSIGGLAGSVPAAASGIYLYGAGTFFVEDNRLQSHETSGLAIACAGVSLVRDNSIIGFGTGKPGCPDDGGNVHRSLVP